MALWKVLAENSLLMSLYFEQENLFLNSAGRPLRGTPWDITWSRAHQSKPSLSPHLKPAGYRIIGLKMKGTLETTCDIVPFSMLLWQRVMSDSRCLLYQHITVYYWHSSRKGLYRTLQSISNREPACRQLFLNHTGLCSFSDTSSEESRLAFIAIPTHKPQGICGSPMVERATKYYQSRGAPLFLQNLLKTHLFREHLLS